MLSGSESSSDTDSYETAHSGPESSSQYFSFNVESSADDGYRKLEWKSGLSSLKK